MRSKRGRKKAKTIAYRFIEPLGIEGKPIYERLQRILEHHHEEVVMARFALAWQINWKPDVDGRLTLGQCRKVSDLDREIVDRFASGHVVLVESLEPEDFARHMDALVNDSGMPDIVVPQPPYRTFNCRTQLHSGRRPTAVTA